jgi:hypothetical protein
MDKDSEQVINSKIAQLQADIEILRESYMALNKRYTKNLASINDLTLSSLEAALRAASAAEKAALACKSATEAALKSADAKVIDAPDLQQSLRVLQPSRLPRLRHQLRPPPQQPPPPQQCKPKSLRHRRRQKRQWQHKEQPKQPPRQRKWPTGQLRLQNH